jgi:hypothetical protein
MTQPVASGAAYPRSMAMLGGRLRQLAVGDGQARLILAYLAVVAASTLLGFGPALMVTAGVLLIPAMVVTIAAVHRLEAKTRVARAVIGAVSWAGWGFFLAITLAVVSQLVLRPELVGTDLIALAAAGAVFAVLAFDGHERRAGGLLIVIASVVVAFVILGSALMAGRWGSPV